MPVIVDLAAEYDITGYLEAGADITIHSAHKFLGDATALYNSKDEGAEDIVYANRSIVWIVPDRIITYDRAASKYRIPDE